MKKLAIAGAVLLVLVAIGVFWAYRSADVMVKTTLERYGPDVLGVPVNVAEVSLSPQTGAGRVRGVEIGSPPFFASQHTAHFGEIRVALDPLTLADDVVLIREVTVDSPRIVYERGREGSNLDAIQKSIDAYVKRAEREGAPAAGTRPPRRFIVDRLTIRGGTVTMTNPALKGQGITFDLPELTLTDLGKPEGGLRASQVASRVTNALIREIARKMLTNVELLKKGGVEGAVDALKGLIK